MKSRLDQPPAVYQPSTPPAPAPVPSWLVNLTDALRARFDDLSRRTSPAFVTIALLASAAAFGWFTETVTRCANLPVSIARLEVTYSASRFAALLGAESACRAGVIRSFAADMLFCVAYGLALAALYMWCERWRRYEPGHDWTPCPHPASDTRRRLFILAPLIAALLDMAMENVPLWWSSSVIQFSSTDVPTSIPPGVGAAVFIGSIGATLKWLLVFASVVAIFTELFSGPRGFVLKRLRFSALAVAFGALPLLFIGQGQDILQRVSEGDSRAAHTLLSVLAIAFASTMVWYCGRRLVQLRFPGDEQGDWSWYPFFATQLPRLLGVTMLALGGAAFAHAGLAFEMFALVGVSGLLVVAGVERFAPRLLLFARPLLPAGVDDSNPFSPMNFVARRLGGALIASLIGALLLIKPSGAWDDTARGLYVLRVAAWLCLVATWLFYIFVYFRREYSAARGHPRSFEAVDSFDTSELERYLRTQVIAAVVVSLGILALFAAKPVFVGRAIGPVWILALAVANAVVFGSIAVWASARYHIPIVRLAIAAALLFSMWNDNHRVRTVGGPAEVAKRISAGQQLDQWLAARGAANPSAVGPVVPVVFVAASGGGLRAAYWTSRALALAQDRDTAFTSHLFAISGVSGGSVGGGVFAAVARDARGNASALPCAANAPARDGYTRCVSRVMGDDFLSPVLAQMVAPDLLQRFLPFPVAAFDRSRGLEESFNRSYESAVGRETMRSGLLALAGDSATRVSMPTLFLNSTHVETGRRYVASPVFVSNALHDSPDVLQLLHADLPLSAAMHNSARFTLVSPAGHLVDPSSEGEELGHVVDGGYFENSGLVTLEELIALADGNPRRAGIRPIVLYLCNDPVSCDAATRTAVPDSVTRTHATWANEILAPVRALLNTREARGQLAFARLRSELGADFLELDVCGTLAVARNGPATSNDSARMQQGRDRVVSPPLGWLLSKLARDWMDSSLVMDSTLADAPTSAANGCRVRNTRQLQRLSVLLHR